MQVARLRRESVDMVRRYWILPALPKGSTQEYDKNNDSLVRLRKPALVFFLNLPA